VKKGERYIGYKLLYNIYLITSFIYFTYPPPLPNFCLFFPVCACEGGDERRINFWVFFQRQFCSFPIHPLAISHATIQWLHSISDFLGAAIGGRFTHTNPLIAKGGLS